MSNKDEIEFYIAINEEGNFEVDQDLAEAINNLNDNHGYSALRTVKMTAKIALPVVIETEVDVPDEAGETQQAAEVTAS